MANEPTIISGDPIFLQRLDEVRQVAGSDITVLLTGESGTGKEVVARDIHAHSKRSDGPFVAVNCGAIPNDLFESEMFGHNKGSFTTAISSREGVFQQADGGTLFLDEVGALSPPHQVKLLRAVQERAICRVGGSRMIPVDIRLITATNVDLKSKIDRGEFREDLYFRLNTNVTELPPLRERQGDVRLLVAHFVREYASQHDLSQPGVDDAAMSALERYHWRGNVRELEHAIERAVFLSQGDRVGLDHLPQEVLAAVQPALSGVAGSAAPGSTDVDLDDLPPLERNGQPLPLADKQLALESAGTKRCPLPVVVPEPRKNYSLSEVVFDQMAEWAAVYLKVSKGSPPDPGPGLGKDVYTELVPFFGWSDSPVAHDHFLAKRLKNLTCPGRRDLTLRARIREAWDELERATPQPGSLAPSPEKREQRVERKNPYAGVVPFEHEDRDLFFGRSEETADIIHTLRKLQHIAVVSGTSGVGKSSLLHAGIFPRLRDEFGWSVAVLRFPGDPAEPSTRANWSAQRLLRDGFKELLAAGRDVALICDQIEDARPGQVQKLFEIVRPFWPDPHLHLVFGVRSEYVRPFFQEMKEGLTDFDVDTWHEIYALTRPAAKEAIRRPAEKRGVQFEDGLVEKILDDLEAGREEMGKVSYPPHVQMVCQTLWKKHFASKDEPRIPAALYGELGGLAGILNAFFQTAIGGLGRRPEHEATHDVLASLVSAEGVPVRKSREQLHAECSHPESLPFALDRLRRARIIHAPGADDEFEFVHRFVARLYFDQHLSTARLITELGRALSTLVQQEVLPWLRGRGPQVGGREALCYAPLKHAGRMALFLDNYDEQLVRYVEEHVVAPLQAEDALDVRLERLLPERSALGEPVTAANLPGFDVYDLLAVDAEALFEARRQGVSLLVVPSLHRLATSLSWKLRVALGDPDEPQVKDFISARVPVSRFQSFSEGLRPDFQEALLAGDRDRLVALYERSRDMLELEPDSVPVLVRHGLVLFYLLWDFGTRHVVDTEDALRLVDEIHAVSNRLGAAIVLDGGPAAGASRVQALLEVTLERNWGGAGGLSDDALEQIVRDERAEQGPIHVAVAAIAIASMKSPQLRIDCLRWFPAEDASARPMALLHGESHLQQAQFGDARGVLQDVVASQAVDEVDGPAELMLGLAALFDGSAGGRRSCEQHLSRCTSHDALLWRAFSASLDGREEDAWAALDEVLDSEPAMLTAPVPMPMTRDDQGEEWSWVADRMRGVVADRPEAGDIARLIDAKTSVRRASLAGDWTDATVLRTLEKVIRKILSDRADGDPDTFELAERLSGDQSLGRMVEGLRPQSSPDHVPEPAAVARNSDLKGLAELLLSSIKWHLGQAQDALTICEQVYDATGRLQYPTSWAFAEAATALCEWTRAYIPLEELKAKYVYRTVALQSMVRLHLADVNFGEAKRLCCEAVRKERRPAMLGLLWVAAREDGDGLLADYARNFALSTFTRAEDLVSFYCSQAEGLLDFCEIPGLQSRKFDAEVACDAALACAPDSLTARHWALNVALAHERPERSQAAWARVREINQHAADSSVPVVAWKIFCADRVGDCLSFLDAVENRSDDVSVMAWILFLRSKVLFLATDPAVQDQKRAHELFREIEAGDLSRHLVNSDFFQFGVDIKSRFSESARVVDYGRRWLEEDGMMFAPRESRLLVARAFLATGHLHEAASILLPLCRDDRIDPETDRMLGELLIASPSLPPSREACRDVHRFQVE